MINKPTCGQLLEIVRAELRTTVSGAVTDGQATAVLSMIDQILQNVANRCDHEIAWLQQEIDQITGCAESLIADGLDADGRLAESLAELGAAPQGLHADEVGHRYSLAGEALSRSMEAAAGTPAQAAVEAVLLDRLDREVLIRGEFQLAARG